MKELSQKIKQIASGILVVGTLFGAPNAFMYVASKKAIEAQPKNELKLEKSYQAQRIFMQSNHIGRMFLYGAYFAGKEGEKKYENRL